MITQNQLNAWQVDEKSIRTFDTRIFHATRNTGSSIADHELYFSEQNEKALSLAIGTQLHAFDELDFELYPLMGGEEKQDVCCHPTRDLAEACARGWFKTGKFCWQTDD